MQKNSRRLRVDALLAVAQRAPPTPTPTWAPTAAVFAQLTACRSLARRRASARLALRAAALAARLCARVRGCSVQPPALPLHSQWLTWTNRARRAPHGGRRSPACPLGESSMPGSSTCWRTCATLKLGCAARNVTNAAPGITSAHGSTWQRLWFAPPAPTGTAAACRASVQACRTIMFPGRRNPLFTCSVCALSLCNATSSLPAGNVELDGRRDVQHYMQAYVPRHRA